MLIHIGIILSVCDNSVEDCSYKNISLPGAIDINILLPSGPSSVVSFTTSTKDVFSSFGTLGNTEPTLISTETIAITETPRTTKDDVIITSSIEPVVGITKTTEDNIVRSTEPVVSSSQNKNSNNIPLILTGTTLGSLFGVAGVIILMKRRQRPQPTTPIFQEPPLVMPRVQRAYQNT